MAQGYGFRLHANDKCARNRDLFGVKSDSREFSQGLPVFQGCKTACLFQVRMNAPELMGKPAECRKWAPYICIHGRELICVINVGLLCILRFK